MKYILNVPRVPQEEFLTADGIAAALVAMKRAINPGTVAERIRELGEADVMPFGNATVIALGEDEARPEKLTLNRSVPSPLAHPQPSPDNALDVPEVMEEAPKSKRLEKSKAS